MTSEQEHAKKPSDYIRQGWCQGAYARDAEGKNVSPLSETAVAWCLDGAVRRAMTDLDLFHEALLRLKGAIGSYSSLLPWNDAPYRTQQQVIELLESVGL